MSYPFLKKYYSHYLPLIKLGFPIIVGQVGMLILTFADTLMVGHHTTQELAAASFVCGIINLFIIVGLGFSYGLSPIIGEYFGAKKYKEAGSALRGSIIANSIVGIGLVAVLLLLYFNVGRLGQPEELLKFIRPFFMLQILSIPFVMLFNALKQFTDSITDTKVSMWLLLFGNLYNIISNYALIFGHFGAPELGLVGSGISTLVARILMVVAFVAVFFVNRRYSEYRKGFRNVQVSGSLLRHLNALGWPIAYRWAWSRLLFHFQRL